MKCCKMNETNNEKEKVYIVMNQFRKKKYIKCDCEKMESRGSIKKNIKQQQKHTLEQSVNHISLFQPFILDIIKATRE